MELYKEIESSFSMIEKLFSKENLLRFINTPISELCLYHFTLGAWIRNNLLYSKGSLLHDLF